MTTLNRREFLRRGAAGMALLSAGGTISGCFSGGGGTSNAQQQQELDIKAYDALVAQLDLQRVEFANKQAMNASAVGSSLFYLKFPGWDPVLYRYDDLTQQTLTYAFSIGSGDSHDYVASDDYVATAAVVGDAIVYTVYDAAAANSVIGTAQTDKPPAGVKWHAYALAGKTLYIVHQSASAHTLKRWTVGAADWETLFTLESAGIQVAEFWNFAVEGNLLYCTESGRLWRVDVQTEKATWIKTKTQVSRVEFDANGVFYTEADGPFYIDAAEQSTDLKAALMANPYQLNNTYKSAHHYLQDLTHYGTTALYVGSQGLFAYDLLKKTAWPLLLSPRSADLRIDYRYPKVLKSGRVIVTGLTSTSGAVGADGPLYTLPRSAWLPA